MDTKIFGEAKYLSEQMTKLAHIIGNINYSLRTHQYNTIKIESISSAHPMYIGADINIELDHSFVKSIYEDIAKIILDKAEELHDEYKKQFDKL